MPEFGSPFSGLAKDNWNGVAYDGLKCSHENTQYIHY
jgi:hypothetical protein